jgi:hypothetical protein
MPAPLINRFVHVHLRSSVDDWLAWATDAQINSLVVEYIAVRPDHLHVEPPKTEEAFSTPRSWHALADALDSWGEANLDSDIVAMLASGCVTASHAASFAAWFKMRERAYDLDAIIKGELRWPTEIGDRDLLHFHAMSLRARLVKELPADPKRAPAKAREFAVRSKDLLVELADISLEIAQLVVAPDETGAPVLPSWFLVELVGGEQKPSRIPQPKRSRPDGPLRARTPCLPISQVRWASTVGPRICHPTDGRKSIQPTVRSTFTPPGSRIRASGPGYSPTSCSTSVSATLIRSSHGLTFRPRLHRMSLLIDSSRP